MRRTGRSRSDPRVPTERPLAYTFPLRTRRALRLALAARRIVQVTFGVLPRFLATLHVTTASRPGGPCAPAGPCGPWGPCCPSRPAAPSAPSAPAEPCGPAAPAEPCGPAAPAGPCGPAAGAGGGLTPRPVIPPIALGSAGSVGSTVRLAARMPVTVGANRTVTLQLPPRGTVAPVHSSAVSLKSPPPGPPMVAALMASGAEPRLRTAIVRWRLRDPVAVSSKSAEPTATIGRLRYSERPWLRLFVVTRSGAPSLFTSGATSPAWPSSVVELGSVATRLSDPVPSPLYTPTAVAAAPSRTATSSRPSRSKSATTAASALPAPDG